MRGDLLVLELQKEFKQTKVFDFVWHAFDGVGDIFHFRIGQVDWDVREKLVGYFIGEIQEQVPQFLHGSEGVRFCSLQLEHKTDALRVTNVPFLFLFSLKWAGLRNKRKPKEEG